MKHSWIRLFSYKRNPKKPPLSHLPHENMEKMAISETENAPPPGTECSSSLILDFPAFRTISKFMLSISYPVWHFVIATSTMSIKLIKFHFKIQFSSVTESCLTLWDPNNCSMPGVPVHHELSEIAQTHVHWVGDVIQSFHPLLSPSPPAFNLSQLQGLF